MPELRDDELVGMFEAFRVDSVREVRPAGVGAVRIGARRRRRTQAGVLAGVAVLLVVLPLAVWAAARPLAERPPVGNDPTLTTTASPVAAAIGDLSIFNIYGTPLTLGAWPDLPSARKCPRTVTLDNGTQSVGGDTYIEINHELVGFADVDGDKRNELLAVIHCTSYPVDALHDIQQVVAVSGGRGDPVRVLGQGIASSASVGRIESVVGRSDGSVLVVATDYGFAYGPVAQRAEQVFTFTGGRFDRARFLRSEPVRRRLAVTADPLN
jgi:hypothetical protein